MKPTALDEFIAERWGDAVAFVNAFKEFEDRAATMFDTEAGRKVQVWLSEKGYEVQLGSKWAEYRAFREDWLKGHEEPQALFVMGGLFPKGFMGKVDCPHPYLWVYLKGDRNVRIPQAKRLRESVPATSQWLHEETNPRQPLGQYLEGVEDADRKRLMCDPDALVEFVKKHMPALLELESLVTNALKSS